MFSLLVDRCLTASTRALLTRATDCCTGRRRGRRLSSVMENASILCGGARAIPEVTLLHEYFQQAVERDAGADTNGVYYQDTFVSYYEINQRANAVARVLAPRLMQRRLELGTQEGQPVVAVDIEPCESLLVALLAILKLGAAYLPIDSHSAINRVRYVLNEAQPLAILVDSTSVFRKDPETVWSGFFIVGIDDVGKEAALENVSQANLSRIEALHPPHLLSVVYTSGSTGRPKGVCLSHQTAMNRLCWQWKTLPFRHHEVGCFKTSLLFVDSIVEVFGCVLQLVPLVVAPKGISGSPDLMVSILEQYRVSRMTTVPSLLKNILTYLSVSGGASRLPDLWLCVSNSETLQPSLMHKFFELFPAHKTMANIYGSTETMADVTFEIYNSVEDIAEKSQDGHLSIGRPMFNNNIYITDEDLNVLPLGETGEICVSGFNVADGYLDSAGKNAFLPNPFAEHTSQKHGRIYRTGDFGLMHRGMIIFKGRRDTQVKIRGQRVNIVEVEKVVQECPGVEKVVVNCHRLSEISSVIVAYYTTHSRKRSTRTESHIMNCCRKCLPAYMQPKLLHLEEIPLQPHTGKVDGLALRKLYEKAFNRQSSQELAVMDEKTQKALNIIALNLNLPTNAVPRKSSFFELGGNSMSMIATIVQLKEYGLHIPIEEFSGAKCIQQIIDQVTESQGPIGEILHTDSYVVKPLRDAPWSETLVDIMAESFTQKEPLVVLLGVTKAEFLPFAKSIYREAMKDNISFIVVDKDTNQIVGGDFLFDCFKPLNVEHHESMDPVLRLLTEFERPVKEKLEQHRPGRLIYNFCLCVHNDLPHAEQVKICHLIEDSVLKVAQREGFVGVVTNNTNPVTQNICQHFFEYKLLSELLVRDFDFHGRKVFAHAPEDYYIKMMMKHVEHDSGNS